LLDNVPTRDVMHMLSQYVPTGPTGRTCHGPSSGDLGPTLPDLGHQGLTPGQFPFPECWQTPATTTKIPHSLREVLNRAITFNTDASDNGMQTILPSVHEVGFQSKVCRNCLVVMTHDNVSVLDPSWCHTHRPRSQRQKQTLLVTLMFSLPKCGTVLLRMQIM